NKLEFLIKWKDYTDKNNLWEPEENCKEVHKVTTQIFKLDQNAAWCIARMEYEGMKFWP
ncbi:hypothetical protein L208DRAFT_1265834, partial [Tricholoma matsutake]